VPAARWLILAGLVLFTASLLLPAVDGAGFPAQSGLDMLQRGAGAWRDQVYAWYANPALGVSLLACWFSRFRTALVMAALAMLLALSSFTAATMAENAGRSVPEFSFAIGFYVWLGAILFAVLAAASGIYKVSVTARV